MMNIPIIYEDEFVLAVDKPSGLLVHADGRSDEFTLVDWIRAKYPELENVGEEQMLQNGKMIKRPGLVHRLDKDTSGVVIIAKTQESFLFLKEQFQNRKLEKVYRSFVWGEFQEREGEIDKPIGRSASDFRRWSAEHGAKGELREAQTHFQVLEQGKGPASSQGGFAYLELKPKTGRTHQIRVHLKAINHPVICDKLYAPNREPALGFERLALHAMSIKIELPPTRPGDGSGTFIKIESELPEDFKNALNLLKS